MKLAMIHSTELAVGYYRTLQPAQLLKEKGTNVFYFTDQSSELPLEAWAKLGINKDAWITQLVDTAMQASLHKGMAMTHNIPLIVDCDDNFLKISKNNPAYVLMGEGKLVHALYLSQIKVADAVTVSTEHLKNELSKYNDNIYVLPNYLDLEVWKGLKPAKHEGIRLGWQGSISHYDDLKLLVPVLRMVFKKHPEVTLHIAGFLPDYLEEFDANIVPYPGVSIDKYPKHLASMGIDIALAPLQDTPFNRSKSAIKWMEYSILGIPTVASGYGPYVAPKNVIRPIQNTPGSWATRINELIENPELRQFVGTSAKAEVILKYDARKHLDERLAAYEEIIGNYQR